MTEQEWQTSNSASEMLLGLYLRDAVYFKTLVPLLHRYFMACCWKVKHLIPQEDLRKGLLGSEKWANGEIEDKDLHKLDYYAEAVCFGFDYAKTPADFDEIQVLIDGIDELKNMSFDYAKELLSNAAWFAEGAIIYPTINGSPYDKSMCNSQFLCASLLKEYIKPDFPFLLGSQSV